jgi:molybdopterin-guanine dinucleotide biosynthesis protein B
VVGAIGANRAEADVQVIGFAGWSGAGKTTLIKKLIPALTAMGCSVSTIKHAHHEFDIDKPGKDSWEHRRAGATEVLVGSANRWALMHELRDEPEPSLAELLAHLHPVDFVLIEGFKQGEHPKIEVHRKVNGKPFLYPEDPSIVALLSDGAASARFPQLDLNDIAGVAAVVLARAAPIDHYLANRDTLPI